MSWDRLIAASVAAGGPVAVRDAAAIAGMPVRSLLRRARREGWSRPFPGVIAVPGTRMDGRARAAAAVVHCRGNTGDDARDLAALTRGSALALVGVQRRFPTSVEVVVPASRAVRKRPGLTVVRSSSMAGTDVRFHRGVPVLAGAALLRELAAVRGRAALRSAAIDLAHLGFVDIDELPAYLAIHRRFPGRPVLRGVADDLLDAGRTDSPLEYQVRARLEAAGIRLDSGQIALPGTRGMHLDLGIEAIRFGIEVDSIAHHASRADLQRDVERANAIAALDTDWRVLHVTYTTLTRFWPRFVGQVREVIESQSAKHGDSAPRVMRKRSAG